MIGEETVAPLYPSFNVVPNREMEVYDFLKNNPAYDGRGTVIAVLDTGVDPSACGMQVTTDGKPKIIDIVDCTGAGDVDTSTVRQAQDGIVIGLTGRKLKIPPEWRNPSGKYHLGVKAIYELYPKCLLERVRDEKRKTKWAPIHRLAVADLAKQMEQFVLANGTDKQNMSMAARLQKDNLEAGCKVLKDMDTNFKDCGPTADCVVFHDGTTWVACMDTTFVGELSKCKLMANYKVNKEYDVISDLDMMTYSFNIYNNGSVLEIACVSGLHGTHVACIAAAYFPDQPQRNGIAPGAQIVSLQIGDNRLEGLETGTAILRAINYCIENNIEIINCSYAEPVKFQNFGKIVEAISNAVINHNLIYVASSGNSGPCLSTVESPGGNCSECIGVAAYVSPAMRTKLYSLRDRIGPMFYTWSARGPCSDGYMGNTVCAPGAAITSTPKWTLRKCELLHGTSMSSPEVAGAVALITSGLKSAAVPYNSLSIRMALSNTAKKVEDYSVFEQGCGLVQVQKAYDYLLHHSSSLVSSPRLKFTVGDQMRGIYLRELHELAAAQEFVVKVQPSFREKAAPNEQFGYHRMLALCCDSDWVKVADHLELSNSSRTLHLRVDPSRLEADYAHHAQVVVYDSDQPALGPIYRFPITVIVPCQAKKDGTVDFRDVRLSSSVCVRHFIHVPNDCNLAVIKVTGRKFEKGGQLLVQIVQLVPDESYHSNEFRRMLTFGESAEFWLTVPLQPGRTMELCLGGWWRNSIDLTIDCDVTFSGLIVSPSAIFSSLYEPIMKVTVRCGMKSQLFQPSLTLNELSVPLKPSNHTIRNLGPRDLFNDCRQCYQLQLSYEFYLDQETTVKPVIPLLSEYLYESDNCGYLWSVYDEGGAYIFSGGYFSHQYEAKLRKGNYSLQLKLRQYTEDELNELKDFGIFLCCQLVSPITVSCYPSYPTAIGKSEKFSSLQLTAHSMTSVYFVGPSKDSLPKNFKTGSCLCGTLTLGLWNGKKCLTFPVQYHLPFSRGNKLLKKNKTAAAMLREFNLCNSIKSYDAMEPLEVMKAIIVKDVRGAETVQRLLQVCIKDGVSELRALLTVLNFLVKQDLSKTANELLTVTTRIFDMVVIEEVLLYNGTNCEYEIKAQQKEEMEEKKTALTMAYYARGLLAADQMLKNETVDLNFVTAKVTAVDSSKTAGKNGENESSIKDSTPKMEDVDEIFVSLTKLAVSPYGQLAEFFVKHAFLRGNIFQAINIIRKHGNEFYRSRRLAELEIDLFRRVGFMHIVSYLTEAALVEFPPIIRPP